MLVFYVLMHKLSYKF